MNLTITVVVALVAGLSLIGVIWMLPHLQVRHLNLSPEERFDRTNEARRTIAQILGGAILLGGFYFNWSQQNQTAQEASENQKIATENQRIARDGQISDAFTKAIEHLGGTSLEVRLGGIFGLESLAKEPGMNHWTVIEVLTAYIRTHAQKNGVVQVLASRPHTPTEIQAVLTVLGRRQYQKGDEWLDLRNSNLEGADLNSANLAWADLIGADMQRADLSNASFKGAHLMFAHLENAVSMDQTCFKGADLSGAFLTPGDLKGAWWDDSTRFPSGVLPGKPSIPEPDSCAR